MRARSLVSSVLAAAVAVAAPLGAARADQPDYEKAQIHYKNAEQAMADGRYAAAAAEYGVAYEITKDPILFYKIGIAHQSAGKCPTAVVYFQRYLKEGKPEEAFRRATEERIAQCGGGSAGGGGAAAGGAGGTGGSVGTGAGGGDAVGGGVGDGGTGDGGGVTGGDLGGGDGLGGDGAGGDPIGGLGGGPTFLDTEPSWMTSAAWISVGATVAFATAGAILAMSAQSREEDLAALADFRTPQGQPAPYEGSVRERYETLAEEGRKFNTWSTIALVAAGVTATAAVSLFVMAPAERGDSGSAITSRRARGRDLAVTPVIGPDGGGFAARLRF